MASRPGACSGAGKGLQAGWPVAGLVTPMQGKACKERGLPIVGMVKPVHREACKHRRRPRAQGRLASRTGEDLLGKDCKRRGWLKWGWRCPSIIQGARSTQVARQHQLMLPASAEGVLPSKVGAAVECL